MINNELAKRIHQNAINKGFWDRDLSTEHCLMLVITELSEAVEADRKGKRSNVEQYVNSTAKSRIRTDNPMYFNRVSFENNIKDTVEDELADAVIRLLDLAGARSFNIERVLIKFPNMKKTFTENIFRICTEIVYYKYSMEERVNYAILNIRELCNFIGIDIDWHIEQKMLYNETREKMHGKAY